MRLGVFGCHFFAWAGFGSYGKVFVTFIGSVLISKSQRRNVQLENALVINARNQK